MIYKPDGLVFFVPLDLFSKLIIIDPPDIFKKILFFFKFSWTQLKISKIRKLEISIYVRS